MGDSCIPSEVGVEACATNVQLLTSRVKLKAMAACRCGFALDSSEQFLPHVDERYLLRRPNQVHKAE